MRGNPVYEKKEIFFLPANSLFLNVKYSWILKVAYNTLDTTKNSKTEWKLLKSVLLLYNDPEQAHEI